MIEVFGFVIGIARLIFSLIITVTSYVLCSAGLYTIARRCGVRCPWVAFVPVAQYYVIGSICEEYRISNFTIKGLSVIMPLLLLLQMLASVTVSVSAWLVSLACNILIALIMHKFYYLYTPQRAVVYAVLSLLGRLPMAIILFMIKDTPMQMSAGAYRYPFS